jgi:hypothetical protein
MEDTPAVYRPSHDPAHPQTCLDEKPVQRLSDVRDPLSAAGRHEPATGPRLETPRPWEAPDVDGEC